MLSAGKTLVLISVLSALFIALLHFAGAVSLFNTDVFFSLILLFVCPALLIAGAVLFIVGKRRRRAAKASGADRFGRVSCGNRACRRGKEL